MLGEKLLLGRNEELETRSVSEKRKSKVPLPVDIEKKTKKTIQAVRSGT